MKNCFLALCFLTLFSLQTEYVLAQLTGDVATIDISFLDRSFSPSGRYDNVNGSPYLFTTWVEGDVKTATGQLLKNLQLKYDQVDDLLLVKIKSGDVKRFAVPIVSFTVTDIETGLLRKFRAGFKSSSFSSERTFFELLVEGKANFMTKDNKTIGEHKDYSGTTVKTVQDDVRYFIALNDDLPVKVKLDAKTILSNFSSAHQVILTSFIKRERLSMKKKDDVIKLFKFYNNMR
jgi:hypothetical protein